MSYKINYMKKLIRDFNPNHTLTHKKTHCLPQCV